MRPDTRSVMIQKDSGQSGSFARRSVRPWLIAIWITAVVLLVPPAFATDFLKWEKFANLPDPIGVAAPFAGVSSNALIVAGGANFPNGLPWEGGKKVWHDAIHVLPEPKAEWRSGFRLPRPNAYGVSITTKEGLVCIGGGDATGHFADVILLKWSNGQVLTEKLPSLPGPIAFASGAMLGDVIYVAGGIEAPDATNTSKGFLALDFSKANPTWEILEPWPGPGRMLAVAAVQDGSFFLASGTDLTAGQDGKPERIYLHDAFRFTPGKGWNRISDMPRAAVAAPSPGPALGQSHFLVLGGDDGSKTGFQPIDQHPGFDGEILAYHTITDTWAKMGTAAVSRVTVPTVPWKNQTIIPSGEVRPGVRSPEVWSLESIAKKSAFGTLDYITLGSYLLAIIIIGLYCSRRHQSTSDFFLGGRRIPWWAAGISIFGTQLSAITFLAIPAKVYATDWTYFLNNLMIVAIAPIVVFFYLPFFRRLNVTTAYEYLEHRFNAAVRMFAAAAFCILQMGRMGIVLFLPALALSAVTGINIYICILLMGILTTLYSATGGIEAVIWTDFAQVIVLLLAAVVSLVLIAGQVDGGFGAIVSTGMAEGKFHMLNWSWDLTKTSVLVMVLGTWLSHFAPYSADQSVVQRYLTTADEKQAAKSIWTNALLVVPASLLFFGVGTALFVFYKTHPQQLNPALGTDAVFPWFISHSLPAGVIGLVIAGVFAAAMSSLDSSINSMSTVITTDFFRRLRPQVSDAQCLRLARTLTVVLGVAGTATALLMVRFSIQSLWDVFLRIVGLLGGGLAGVFVLGIFTRRANATGAIIGALLSAVLLAWIQRNTALHFFLYGGIGMLSCVVIGYLTSFVLGGRPQISDGLTIHPNGADGKL
jgi:SSS family solute:Na+ symporter